MPETTTRSRPGGRAARRALRAAPIPEALRPIQPGMSGGRYKPLTEDECTRIYEAALKALAEIGLADAPPSGVKLLIGAGAIAGEDGRIRFPRALIEDALARTTKDLVLHARDPRFDLDLSGSRVHFGTAGAAVLVVEEGPEPHLRPSTLADLHNAARIVQQLDNVHFFQRTMVARDIEDPLEMDLNTLYACVSGTTKHIGTSISDPANAGSLIEMLHQIASGEAAWRKRPFVLNSNCFVVPPMKFATESCETMEACIRAGMPILLLSAGQAGATAPAPLATTIVQATAECLAGLVYVNAIRPGHPAIFGTWPFVSDLRTGAMSGGSGEQALLSAACGQMHAFLGLPGGAAAGIADAKTVDMQAGWEQSISNTMAGLSGLNMVYEAVGMHASLLGFSFESLVLGNDMLGQIQRCIRGVEVTEESLSLETMRAVCMGGPGHYLGQNQTLSLMQTEYIYPELADRTSPKEWEERGRPNLIETARTRITELLARPPEAALPAQLDATLREAFPIYL